MRLITIPLSHYCEKARWGLAYANVDYVEEAHLQVFHYRAVRAHSPLGKVPVLIGAGGAVADSTAILHYLDQHHLPADRKLYPEEVRGEVEALEERFDEELGVETRRWVYFHWLRQPRRQVLRIAAQGTPRWERALAPMLYPLMRGFLKSKLEITPQGIELGMRKVADGFDEVAARLADGRQYLVGGRFTAADLTFASLAAPILLPPEYGIRLPTLEEAPPAARAEVEHFRAHPAGQFVLRLYRERRRPGQHPTAPH